MKITRVKPILVRTPLKLDDAQPHAGGKPKNDAHTVLVKVETMSQIGMSDSARTRQQKRVVIYPTLYKEALIELVPVFEAAARHSRTRAPYSP